MELLGEVLFKIFEALRHLFIAGIVYFSWNIARKETIKRGYKKTLFKGLCWCAGIALFSSFTLGQPTCTDYDRKPEGGGTCYEYADDGHKPTTGQRVAEFSYFMTLFYIPVILGIFKGKREKRIKEILGEMDDYTEQNDED